MKTLLIVVISVFLSSSLWAQGRKMVVEYTEGGKKVIKQFNGKEMDELQAKVLRAKQNNFAKETLPSSPSKMRVVIQEGNKPPVTYSESEYNALLAVQKSHYTPSQVLKKDGLSVVSIKQPDGSVKIIKNGIEDHSK